MSDRDAPSLTEISAKHFSAQEPTDHPAVNKKATADAWDAALKRFPGGIHAVIGWLSDDQLEAVIRAAGMLTEAAQGERRHRAIHQRQS